MFSSVSTFLALLCCLLLLAAMRWLSSSSFVPVAFGFGFVPLACTLYLRSVRALVTELGVLDEKRNQQTM